MVEVSEQRHEAALQGIHMKQLTRPTAVVQSPEDQSEMTSYQDRLFLGELKELLKIGGSITAYFEKFLGESRRNYDRIKQLERLRDDYTQMIVHDLKSPLN